MNCSERRFQPFQDLLWRFFMHQFPLVAVQVLLSMSVDFTPCISACGCNRLCTSVPICLFLFASVHMCPLFRSVVFVSPQMSFVCHLCLRVSVSLDLCPLHFCLAHPSVFQSLCFVWPSIVARLRSKLRSCGVWNHPNDNRWHTENNPLLPFANPGAGLKG